VTHCTLAEEEGLLHLLAVVQYSYNLTVSKRDRSGRGQREKKHFYVGTGVEELRGKPGVLFNTL